MGLIINLETTTTNCSVSLSKDGEILVLKEDYGDGYSHAEKLHRYIEYVFNESGFSKNDLDAVSVSKGPGSYTGLRIGVSAAKGLCYALDVPLISVNTLLSLAKQVSSDNGLIIPLLDARRDEVYTAVFSSAYDEIKSTNAHVLTEDSFTEYLDQHKVYFIGNGVEKTHEIIRSENAVFISGKLPSAEQMGTISEEKFRQNEFEDLAYFEPYYLKDFIALKAKPRV